MLSDWIYLSENLILLGWQQLGLVLAYEIKHSFPNNMGKHR